MVAVVVAVCGLLIIGLAVAAARYDRSHVRFALLRAAKRRAAEDETLDVAAAAYGLAPVRPAHDTPLSLSLTLIPGWSSVTRFYEGTIRDRQVWLLELAVEQSQGPTLHHVVGLTKVPFDGPWLRVQPHAAYVVDGTPFDTVHTESGEFDRRFHVSCPDKRFATAVLAPTLMEWLLDSARAYEFELCGGWAAARKAQSSEPLRPEDIGVHLAAIVEFAQRVPAVVSSLYPVVGDATQ